MTNQLKDHSTPAHRKLFGAVSDAMNEHDELGKAYVLAERPDAAAEPPQGQVCVLWGIDPNDGSRVCLKWQ